MIVGTDESTQSPPAMKTCNLLSIALTAALAGCASTRVSHPQDALTSSPAADNLGVVGLAFTAERSTLEEDATPVSRADAMLSGTVDGGGIPLTAFRDSRAAELGEVAPVFFAVSFALTPVMAVAGGVSGALEGMAKRDIAAMEAVRLKLNLQADLADALAARLRSDSSREVRQVAFAVSDDPSRWGPARRNAPAARSAVSAAVAPAPRGPVADRSAVQASFTIDVRALAANPKQVRSNQVTKGAVTQLPLQLPRAQTFQGLVPAPAPLRPALVSQYRGEGAVSTPASGRREASSSSVPDPVQAALEQQGIKTVLTLRVERLGLRKDLNDERVNPLQALSILIAGRLIRVADKSDAGSVMAKYESEPRRGSAWAANDAKLLRTEWQAAMDSLAAQVADWLRGSEARGSGTEAD